MTEPKTSTFIIDHDQCDPSKWTAADVLNFARFMRSGRIEHAPALARLGMRLVVSDQFQPTGGTIQKVGWIYGDDVTCGEFASELEDVMDRAVGSDTVAEVIPVFAGLPEYVVPIPIGDADGMLEGYEYEFKPTRAEADDYARQIHEQTSE